MSGWRKFGVALYYSTTLTATTAIGFALFAGAAPSNINLFDKNCDVRNWVFITAAVSLAYITLSALTMFCVLTTAKKSTDSLQPKLKVDTGVYTDYTSDGSDKIYSPSVKSAASSVYNEGIDQINKEFTDYLRSKDNKLHTDNYTDLFAELGNAMNSKLKEMEERDKQVKEEQSNQLKILQERTKQQLNKINQQILI